jgi:hypothetical protein
MSYAFRSAAAVAALIAGLGIAAAQQPADQPTNPQPAPTDKADPQPEPTDKSPWAKSPTTDVDEQGKRTQQSPSGRAGREEPGSHVPTSKPMETAVFVNGRLNVPGAPQDGQTVPAKFSERNAALDRLPIMAMPLGLSDEQRKKIRDSVMRTNTPVAPVDAHPAQILPSSIALHDLPKDVADISGIDGLKFVVLQDRILLVRAPNWIVVGEIK